MVVIRPLHPDDVQACAEIMAATPLWRDYGLDVQRSRAIWESGLSLPTETLRVGIIDEQIVGFLWYSLRGTLFHGGYLRFLGVGDHYRSQGIGAILLRAAEAHIAEHSRHVFLLAAQTNVAAHRFYQREGYQLVGQLPGYVKPDLTEYIFWKRLVTGGGISQT